MCGFTARDEIEREHRKKERKKEREMEFCHDMLGTRGRVVHPQL